MREDAAQDRAGHFNLIFGISAVEAVFRILEGSATMQAISNIRPARALA